MDVLACAGARWSPGIGDPTVWGWLTVLGYLASGAACGLAARRALVRRETLFWSILAAGLLLLAINKQLDLQSALTETAKCLAKADGWYAERRRVQVAFVGLVAASSVAGACALAFAVRRSLRRLWPAVLGAALVLGFVAIRAAGFHKVDRLIGQSALGVTVNAALELGGILLILWAAAREAGRRRPRLAKA